MCLALSTPSLRFFSRIHKPAFFYSPAECISAYINAHLQLIVKSLPSHVKDTNNFFNLTQSLPTPLLSNIIMMTINVTLLYTNNSHPLVSLEHFLNQCPPKGTTVGICMTPSLDKNVSYKKLIYHPWAHNEFNKIFKHHNIVLMR